jgi:hypothetical protein
MLPAKAASALSLFAITTDARNRALAIFGAMALGTAALLAVALPGRQLRSAINLFVVSTVTTMSIMVPTGLLLAYQYKCRDFQALLAETARMQTNPILFGHRSPSAIFYLRKPVQFADGENELLALAQKEAPGRCFLLSTSALHYLADAGVPLKTIKQSGDWQIVQKR